MTDDSKPKLDEDPKWKLIVAIIGLTSALVAAIVASSLTWWLGSYKETWMLTLDKVDISVLAGSDDTGLPDIDGSWIAKVTLNIDGRDEVSSYALRQDRNNEDKNKRRGSIIPLNQSYTVQMSRWDKSAIANVKIELTPMSGGNKLCKQGILTFQSIKFGPMGQGNGIGFVKCPDVVATANESILSYSVAKL
jgi:hypothetical protein